jgi:glycosyltransferase 2 family protein
MRNAMRRAGLLLIKAAVSICLLYLAMRSIHPGALIARIRHADPAWITAAVGLLAVQAAVVGLRWRMVARPLTERLSAAIAIELSFIGVFFSQVLPSTVGGDAVRIWVLARRGAGWKTAAYSVVVDRVAGVAALALIVLACLPWTLRLLHDPLAQSMLMLIGFGAIGASALFLVLGIVPLPLLDRFAPTRHLIAAAQLAYELCRTPALASGISVSSFCSHALSVAAAWMCARAVGAPVNFIDLLFLLPPVILVSTVPLSIAGWGVRESSMVMAFGAAGLAPADGLLLSILFGAMNFIVGAIGGLVWIMGGRKQLLRAGEPVAVADRV